MTHFIIYYKFISLNSLKRGGTQCMNITKQKYSVFSFTHLADMADVASVVVGLIVASNFTSLNAMTE